MLQPNVISGQRTSINILQIIGAAALSAWKRPDLNLILIKFRLKRHTELSTSFQFACLYLICLSLEPNIPFVAQNRYDTDESVSP